MLQHHDIQPGKHLQINRTIQLRPNNYGKWWDHQWEISKLCKCEGHYFGTIVSIDDDGLTLEGHSRSYYSNSGFKLSHQDVAQYWVPYYIVDAQGNALNVGDKIFYSDSKGELIKGEISSIEGWGFNNRVDSYGMQLKLINLEYPLYYKRQEYKTRTVVAGSTVIKI